GLRVSLGAASSAFGPAVISPPVAQSKTLQHFVLAVPTEKEGAVTTSIVLTVPDGFAIDSFQASPGWRRTVKATGSGEEQTIQEVSWTGGRVPTDVDAVFGFVASANDSNTFKINVRKTHSHTSGEH